MKGRRAYVASKGLLDAANNREIWNMSLSEVLEYEAEKTGSTLPEPPEVHHTLLVGPQVLKYATQHYEVRRALESACWSGYEAVGDWLEMFIVETGIETDGEFEYVLGDEDQLSINWEPEPDPDQPTLESQPEQTEPRARARAYRDEWINPQRIPEF
jgi:hypothetical protein